jgi:hypothetical protein
MEITWEHNRETRRAEVEPHVLPYVNALGLDRAAAFLIAFGGTSVYVAKSPRSTPLLTVIGADGIAALHEEFGNFIERVPMARRFVIRQLRSKGMLINQIARAVGSTDVSVRAALKSQIKGQA